jgi:hypothetical protein
MVRSFRCASPFKGIAGTRQRRLRSCR